jgi:hypothetical protein
VTPAKPFDFMDDGCGAGFDTIAIDGDGLDAAHSTSSRSVPWLAFRASGRLSRTS